MIATQSPPKALLSKLKHRMFMLSPVVELGLDRELVHTDLFVVRSLGQGRISPSLSSGSYGKVSLVKIKGQSVPIPGVSNPPLKEFAVKEIEKDLILKYKIDKQVLNEIRIMYTLDHDNIIKLYNHFEDDKKCYLIMEYAHGVDEHSPRDSCTPNSRNRVVSTKRPPAC